MGGMGGIQKSEAVAKEHAMEGLMIPALPGSSSSIGTPTRYTSGRAPLCVYTVKRHEQEGAQN